MRNHEGAISIWFFIGVLLLIYGVLITGVGLMHMISPSATQPVLGELHADLWWGLLLVAIGAHYSWHFRPGKA